MQSAWEAINPGYRLHTHTHATSLYVGSRTLGIALDGFPTRSSTIPIYECDIDATNFYISNVWETKLNESIFIDERRMGTTPRVRIEMCAVCCGVCKWPLKNGFMIYDWMHFVSFFMDLGALPCTNSVPCIFCEIRSFSCASARTLCTVDAACICCPCRRKGTINKIYVNKNKYLLISFAIRARASVQ